MSKWQEKLALELHQAEAAKETALQEISLKNKEIRHIQESQKLCVAEIEARYKKLQELRDTSERVQGSLDGLQKNLEVAEKDILFTRELQKLKKPIDLRKLPCEIQQMIFELLLVEKSPIQVPKCYGKHHNLAIFRTCKEIKEQTYATFFGLNCFEIIQRNTYEITHFLEESSLRKVYLGHIKLHIGKDTNILDCLRALEDCQSLKSLSMTIASVPSFRRAHNPDNLCSLKFSKPSTLSTIEICCEPGHEHQDNIRKTCAILQDVLENGQRIQPVNTRWNLRSTTVVN